MGQEVERLALERGHEIVFRSSDSLTSNSEGLKLADVAIEFSRPEAAADNIFVCIEKNIPVVVGTTGWYNRLVEVKDFAIEKKGCLLYSTNFSIGVNIIFRLNEILAKIMDENKEYRAEIREVHHLQKLDKPSGTAISLAEGILDASSTLKKWQLDEASSEEVLPVFSFRQEDVPGTHVVTYESDVDKIQIFHEAKNRKGFALGAIKAAEWLQGKTGVFTMKDYLKF